MTRIRSRWPRMVDSPLLAGALIAAGLTIAALREVDSVHRRAGELERTADRALAVLAADTVAARVSPDTVSAMAEVGGVAVAIARDDAVVRLATRTPLGAVRRFTCAILPGAFPAAFGRAIGADVPSPDPAALATAARAGDHPCFRRDPGIALRHLECGTDLEDFALFEGPSPLDLGAARTILVPGHLWVPPGAAPLRVQLTHDVTIVVEGNLYIGSSLEVRGGGRLLLVTSAATTGAAFADRDGNGRWSAGDTALAATPFHGAVEGVGSAYLGLPRRNSPLMLGCGLVVAGAAHVFAPVVVEGPLALAHEPVVLAPEARVVAAGTHLFRPERERVPGFSSVGAPRCGLPVAADVPTGDRELALYLAAPAR